MINLIPYDFGKYSHLAYPKEYAYGRLNALKLEHIILDLLNNKLKNELLSLLVLDKFRFWSLHNLIPLDWRTTLFLLNYLRWKESLPSEQLSLLLVAIAASQWTYFDKTLQLRLYVYDTTIKDQLIYAEKSQHPKLNRKSYSINNLHQLTEPTIFSFENVKELFITHKLAPP